MFAKSRISVCDVISMCLKYQSSHSCQSHCPYCKTSKERSWGSSALLWTRGDVCFMIGSIHWLMQIWNSWGETKTCPILELLFPCVRSWSTRWPLRWAPAGSSQQELYGPAHKYFITACPVARSIQKMLHICYASYFNSFLVCNELRESLPCPRAVISCQFHLFIAPH